MAERITTPRIGWTGHIVLRSWLKDDGVWVTSGVPICIVTVDERSVPLAAHTDGFLHLRRPIPRPGTRLAAYQELGVIRGANESPTSAHWGPGLPPRTGLRIDRRLETELARSEPLRRRRRSTPRARKSAATAGVDLSGIAGTGREGRIRARDIRPLPEAIPPQRVEAVETVEKDEGKSTVMGGASTAQRAAEDRRPELKKSPLLRSPETVTAVRTLHFAQATWDIPAEGNSAATRPGSRSFASQAPEWGSLLQRLGALLLAHPTLLSRPRDITGVIRIRIQSMNRDQPAQWMVSWNSTYSAEDLLRATRKNDDALVHFECHDLSGLVTAATAPLHDAQRGALTIGTAQLTPVAARPQSVWVWRRILTLTYDTSALGLWQAANLLQILTTNR